MRCEWLFVMFVVILAGADVYLVGLCGPGGGCKVEDTYDCFVSWERFGMEGVVLANDMQIAI